MWSRHRRPAPIVGAGRRGRAVVNQPVHTGSAERASDGAARRRNHPSGRPDGHP
ncbi:hypothetical protein Ae406Ps2_3884c [Pseudonocardia sp. Ae406_Ps2]|nr:hypothetical protein Ae331Ps2_2064 [Pseudonocardia sp. Ae331_Ps2]OLM03884.1 hypothetical protein Ae406Ps2_3884c [Pseudonocardia sp. Ae406_Ps2]OLM25439.1 hypothetical protein Ae706Ps2_3872c [Pseudonocardia sp. Ae706_Ps2]